MPTVLIVDDEQGIRENLQIGLKMKGFDTLLATQGEEAITTALRSSPDVILLDVMLPKINGADVCKRLKALMVDFVPIIMVTALDDVQSKMEGVEYGADDYVTKPFKIEELVARITSMLRIKSSHDDLKKRSVTDYLTGVPNRRCLETRLREEFARAQRSEVPFSCLMIDLDNFKLVNDRLGHHRGDWVLKRVVQFLQTLARPGDFLARYGGDEFVLLLPETSLQDAKKLAEQIQVSLGNEVFSDGESETILSCTIGLFEFPNQHMIDMEDLIGGMDEVFYRAKKRGRKGGTP